MKILTIIEYLPPYQGSDKSIYELLNQLNKKITINYLVIPPLRTLWEYNKFSTDSTRFLYFYKLTYGKKENKIEKNVVRIKLPKFLLKLWKKNIIISFLLTTIYNFISLLRILNKEKYDLIIINHPSPSSGLLGFVIAKMLNKPYIMGYPDLISDYAKNLMETDSHSLLNKILELIEKYQLIKSPKIITVTDYLKNYLLSMKINEDDVKVISNGVDLNIFDYKIDGSEIRKKYNLDNKYVVIYVGHIEKWAGIEDIINSAEKLKNEDIVFLLVGDGNLRNELEKKLNKNVIFAGLQPYEKIPYFIAASNIAVLTFPKTPTSHGASPLKLFEYMAMKKPVITTYIKGIDNVIENKKSGLIIRSDNTVAELVDLILWLKNNPQIAENIGINAYNVVKNNFTWEKLSKIFVKFCTKYLKERYYKNSD
ncbi:MAG: glycosyltransferase family 4 protein [Candidatus Helarchaeota archaeon]